jgi:hypothetical protein
MVGGILDGLLAQGLSAAQLPPADPERMATRKRLSEMLNRVREELLPSAPTDEGNEVREQFRATKDAIRSAFGEPS